MTISFAKTGLKASLALAGILVAAFSYAAVQVNLTGAEETPPVKTAASGTASITVSADKTVTGSVNTQGLSGTAAHIHLGATGQKGPPVISLNKSGDGSWVVPEGSKLTDEQYASYQKGDLYINVHSADNKGGEIRGQIKP